MAFGTGDRQPSPFPPSVPTWHHDCCSPVTRYSAWHVAQYPAPIRRDIPKGLTVARYFPAIIEKSSDGFGVFFPDLPGCTSAGLTVQEAARNAEDALQAHIDLASEHGDPIPEPSELDHLTIDPDIDEVARVLVRVELPGRAVRVNITLPEELLAAVDRYATRTGFSRSGLLAQAVRERMRAGS